MFDLNKNSNKIWYDTKFKNYDLYQLILNLSYLFLKLLNPNVSAMHHPIFKQILVLYIAL